MGLLGSYDIWKHIMWYNWFLMGIQFFMYHTTNEWFRICVLLDIKGRSFVSSLAKNIGKGMKIKKNK